MGYIRTVLPTLNAPAAESGLPHRIVVDEAHYFLHDPDVAQLLDLEQNGYTVVTYYASGLPKALLAATEVMIVTCESNPSEIEALKRSCARCTTHDDRWAVLRASSGRSGGGTPITEEAGGGLRAFTMGPRLTPHVRHREKSSICR